MEIKDESSQFSSLECHLMIHPVRLWTVNVQCALRASPLLGTNTPIATLMSVRAEHLTGDVDFRVPLSLNSHMMPLAALDKTGRAMG